MKKDKVKVGCKFGTEHYQVLCAIDIPESIEDVMKLSKGSAEFAVKMFERGWRIWNQEQSGARDFIQQSTVQMRKDDKFPARIQAIIDSADPLAPPSRTGRPSKPKEVSMTPEIQAAMKKGDLSKFAELLADQGVKVAIKQQ